MVHYNYKSYFINSGGLFVPTFVMGSNSQRVALTVSAQNAAVSGSIYRLMLAGDHAKIWAQDIAPSQDKYIWLDWGPVIQEEIWVDRSDASLLLFFTEIWRLPIIT